MAHRKFDLVQETSTSTGSTTLALVGAVTRRRRFGDVLSNTDTCYVLIEHASAAEWQVCLATWNTGHTLTLGTVLASSTGAAVSFSAGTKTISMVAPAAKSIVEDNNGDVSITRNASVGATLSVLTKVLGLGNSGAFRAAEGSNTLYYDFGRESATGYFVIDGNQPGVVSYDFRRAGVSMLRLTDGGDLLIPIGASRAIHQTAQTTHIAGNAGSISMGINDGGGLTGIQFVNAHDGSYSYQYIVFKTAKGGVSPATERMRIDENGNVGIGTTPASFFNIRRDQNTGTDAVIENGNAGASASARMFVSLPGISGAYAVMGAHANGGVNPYVVLEAGAAMTGGAYLDWRGPHYFRISGTDYAVLDTSRFRPGSDNNRELGHGSYRWKEIFAGNATINTSGRAAKVDITDPTETERKWATLIKARGPRRYRFKDAVEQKGKAARFHFGYVVEDMIEDAAAAGIADPWAYSFLCADPLIKSESYTVASTRPKTRKVTTAESGVEIIDGKPVLVRRERERNEPVGEMVTVVDESGEPVMQKVGEEPNGEVVPLLDNAGNPVMVHDVVEREGASQIVEVPATRAVMRDVMAPLMHFVPETEEYEAEHTREVDTGEVRFGLRYSELEAFLRCAD